MALKELTILFVEDDPVFRKIVTAFLESRGAIIIEADDGELGLNCFKKQDFDVVLADLSMPNLGGLEMLKAMNKYRPGTPSIIISGNQAMSNVVDALRNGASDYLVKPVADLYLIENAIQECLNGSLEESLQIDELESLSYMELNQNLELLEQSEEAAKSVQQQLFPPSRIEYSKAAIDYSLFNTNEVSAHFIDTAMLDDSHIMMYMAHFQPHDNRAAFASVLLKSFVNHKLKRYQNKLSTVIAEPFNMLSYLNDRMLKSGLDIYVDMTYVVINLSNYRVAIAQAGAEFRCYLRNSEGLSPLALAETLQLGMVNWGNPSIQFRTLMPGEQLCISTNVSEHKRQLLNDQFHGLIHDTNTPPGGYIQLSAS
ncbi:two-component system response regulator [Shewanella sp. Choline-02u-19]|uniref:response regulator n=1 Tax=unclassified Shewanella TaxID=196818 RepID=UPI000C32D282|nr:MULTISPECIES: response regulator [unclassified Shewanella]PKH55686.1 two-component system response regulator [Shewanella sp. Bg11-22]PKI26899.1 two-component system response regulator [Shewanella sp. Choline-02u-19]